MFVLYSTIIVIFFVFVIHTEDLLRKKEVPRQQLYAYGLPLMLLAGHREGGAAGLLPVEYVINTDNFLKLTSSGEFYLLYHTLYFNHWWTFFFFFFFMLGGCFSVVSVLALQRSVATRLASFSELVGSKVSAAYSGRSYKTGFFFSGNGGLNKATAR